MLYDAAERPGSLTPAELRAAYEAELRSVVETVGADAVVAETGLDRETVAALADGESVELTLEEAASVLATDESYPDDRSIVMEVRDHLLMGMTTGVLDVDTIAAEIEPDLTGQEVQQALEGRVPMTLAELAAIHGFVAERNDR
ncbi:DUF5791 family protein [Halegenticoccus tardaugens]|uniref:DUF5791 family protein n=1 Tax=Halegenticoccus tardaugens TaxID=2071624 RepID=UPI00100A430C|nr:DUF5791 family protein [Halegenticoccus tardaugens]